MAPFRSTYHWRICVCLGFVFAHAFAAAQESGTVAPSRTMQGEAQSAGESVQSLEKKLDALVARIQSGISRSSARRLRSLQIEWKAFVKADCAWEMKFAGGGSIAPLVYANCMQRHLTARIDRLKPILCEGAGMTGSCSASQEY